LVGVSGAIAGIFLKQFDQVGDRLGDTFGPGLAHGIEEEAVIVSGGAGGGRGRGVELGGVETVSHR
jgi:hypothetical protein